jgi:hypothetical protein
MSMRNLIGRLEEGSTPTIIPRDGGKMQSNGDYLLEFARNLQRIGALGEMLQEVSRKVKSDDLSLLTKSDKDKMQHIVSQLEVARDELLAQKALDRLQGLSDKIGK